MDAVAEQYATKIITKGRRTKRQRSASASTGRCDGGFGSHYSSSTASASGNCNSEDQDIMSEITTEEEDMANCLILLAQGTTTTTTVVEKVPVGSSRYECKTCNKSFHSFQALGGHRASHKKPKLITNSPPNTDHGGNEINSNQKNKAAVVNNKVHECSICGSEFPSGQALGGHMRRHRAPPPIKSGGASQQQQQQQPPRNVLSLDLNLPAPGDDDDDADDDKKVEKEGRLGHENSIGTTTFHRATVDCHY